MGILRAEPPRTPIGWFILLRRQYPQWYVSSPRSLFHPKPWPPGFHHRRNPVFAHNELFLPAVSPESVFDVLRRAPEWPEFYPNCADVRIASRSGSTPAPKVLKLWTPFSWRTFSTWQQSEVTLYEPGRALGWTAESFGTHAFHRWLLIPQQDGTRVITEECQHGFTAWIDRPWMNPSLHAAHQLWLERLKARLCFAAVSTPGICCR